MSAVDPAEPVVPLDEAPVFPAGRGRGDHIAHEIGMCGAEAHDTAAGIARIEPGGGLGQKLGRCAAILRQHQPAGNPAAEMEMDERLVAHG